MNDITNNVNSTDTTTAIASSLSSPPAPGQKQPSPRPVEQEHRNAKKAGRKGGQMPDACSSTIKRRRIIKRLDATMSLSAVIENEDEDDLKTGEEEGRSIATAKSIEGKKERNTVRNTVDNIEFRKFLSLERKSFCLPDGNLLFQGSYESTESNVLRNVIKGFEMELESRKSDISICEGQMQRAVSSALSHLESGGEDLKPALHDIELQLRIIGMHRKRIGSILDDKVKREVSYEEKCVNYIVSKRVYERNTERRMLGLSEARLRLQKSILPPVIDTTPILFDKNHWIIIPVDSGIRVGAHSIEKTLRLKNPVINGIYSFSIKILSMAFPFCDIVLGCVPVTCPRETYNAQSLIDIGFGLDDTGRIGSFRSSLLQPFTSSLSEYDIIETVINMNARTLSYRVNGVDVGEAFQNLPAEGVFPSLSVDNRIDPEPNASENRDQTPCIEILFKQVPQTYPYVTSTGPNSNAASPVSLDVDDDSAAIPHLITRVSQVGESFRKDNWTVSSCGRHITKGNRWSATTLRLHDKKITKGVWVIKVRVVRIRRLIRNRRKTPHIAIGYVSSEVNFLRYKRCVSEIGFGYSDSGSVNPNGGEAAQLLDKFTENSIIQMTIDMGKRTIGLMLDGIELTGFPNKLPVEGVYPALCLYDSGNAIEILN